MIKFSIITVCLNAGNDLLETVESTLKQSYDEFEIIVKVIEPRCAIRQWLSKLLT